ncbi:Neuropeptide-Like Protein [Caenorhabditis elegans]|uniref:Neuropeptide-Like Protein n=1 Tax=Caenorhabditis elegans TaxID=6239 RepID=Q564S8_CAEEL|nr:Neuropeptide-Like Protein [Caenorhabditis elegans]CAI79156.1 Neuropeptide-Like Protein [Caenorhabditis elegans]|eukprot:NP_001021061.1 Uncharacterized protein CELE_C54C8.12 [Caenorhabditis elegans]
MKIPILISLFTIFFGVIALESPIPEFYPTEISTKARSHGHPVNTLGESEDPNFQVDNVPGERARRHAGPRRFYRFYHSNWFY